MPSWSDLAGTDPARVWQRLRSMRHAPPGHAKSGARKATFNAALEQAEQLYRAAGQVGPSTRPILLFYGLSQFGRAMAAASPILDNSNYRLVGHGLKDSNLDSAAIALTSLPVHGSKGSFTSVAQTLGSSPISDGKTLGELWSWIPDAGRIPLQGAESDERILRLDASGEGVGEDWAAIRVSGLPYGPMVKAQEDQDYPKVLRLVGDFLAGYPGLADWQPIGPDDIPIFISYPGTDQRNVVIKLPKKKPGITTAQLIDTRATARYRSRNLLYPAVDSSGLPIHPFMIWWAVLFTLSRLARYQPREWDMLINIAQHPSAAAIEYLLQEALLALPELSLNSLERVVELDPSTLNE